MDILILDVQQLSTPLKTQIEAQIKPLMRFGTNPLSHR